MLPLKKAYTDKTRNVYDLGLPVEDRNTHYILVCEVHTIFLRMINKCSEYVKKFEDKCDALWINTI